MHEWIIPLLSPAFFGYLIYDYIKDDKKLEKKMKPFNDNVSQYLENNKLSKTAFPIKGKIITVDLRTKTVDPFDAQIKPEYVPNKPSEVDIAIVHDCEDVVTGTYTSGAKAIQEHCMISVVDVKNKVWYQWGKIEGSMPPDSISRRRGQTMSDERGSKGIHAFLIKHLH